MGRLLRVLFEIRRQELIFGTVQVAVFPVRFHELNGSVAHMFSVHLLQAVQKVVGVEKGNETVPPSFTSSPISDYSRHLEGGVSFED